MKKKDVTVVDVLKRMRTLLRKGWSQGNYAHTASGYRCAVWSPGAASFCLIGAHRRAVIELQTAFGNAQQSLKLIANCAKVDGEFGIYGYNDAKGRKKSEIIKVVSCAIEKAQGAS